MYVSVALVAREDKRTPSRGKNRLSFPNLHAQASTGKHTQRDTIVSPLDRLEGTEMGPAFRGGAKSVWEKVEAREREGEVKLGPGEVEDVRRKENGKGPWMLDLERKLSEALEIGVRSSGKDETRCFRVAYYTGRVVKAEAEAKYFEAMLGLEDSMEELGKRFDREIPDLEEELKKLKLKDRVMCLRERLDEGESEAIQPSEGEPGEDEEWDTTVGKGEVEAGVVTR
jgi:hypothetical protein